MHTRRQFLSSAAAVGTASILAAPAVAQTVVRIPREWLPTDVEIQAGLPTGMIHVDTPGRWLYLITGESAARRYKIAVGGIGRNFSGQATVRRKATWPAWTPTQNMIRLEPDVYGPYAGGLPGGHPRNPLGSAALYLYVGGRDTYYRIHGTPQPWTMGRGFSSGCVRMINEHMDDLYARVPIGTQVYVSQEA